jgi:hypothetical protein
LEGWLNSKQLERGAVVAPQTVYALGADWYATRLDFDWERASPAMASAIFKKHGLTGAFWSLS